MRALDRGVPIGVPAHRDLADDPTVAGQPGGLARGMPVVDQIASGSTAIRWSASGRICRRPSFRPCHPDADRDVGHVPQSRGVDLEVVARQSTRSPPNSSRMITMASRSMSCRAVHRGPTPADDVLVEVLTAAQAQGESTVGEDLHRRGLLRDDRRVIAHRRARHVGGQVDAVRWPALPPRAPSTRSAHGLGMSARVRSGRWRPRSRNPVRSAETAYGQGLSGRSAQSSGYSRSASWLRDTRTPPRQTTD